MKDIFGRYIKILYFCIRFRERERRLIDILTETEEEPLLFSSLPGWFLSKLSPLKRKMKKNFRKHLEDMK